MEATGCQSSMATAIALRTIAPHHVARPVHALPDVRLHHPTTLSVLCVFGGSLLSEAIEAGSFDYGVAWLH